MQLKKIAFVVSGCSILSVSAAENVATTDTIVVSANLYEQDLSQVQNSITVVNEQDVIESGSFTVVDAIQDVPSLNVVADGTPGVKRVSIRGESSSRTVVAVDGQRIDDQKNKSGVPLLINPYFIDRIEVVRGPSSVLYGSDALGGVINVITKKASDKPFSPEAGVIYNGSGNGFSEFLNLTGTVNNFRYAFGGMYNDMGDMYLSGHDRLDNTSYRQKALNASIEYDFTEKLTAGLNYELFDSSSNTSTTVDHPDYKNFRAYLPKWQREKVSLFTEIRDLNDYVQLIKFSVYKQDVDKDFSSTNDSTFKLGVGTTNEQEGYGANLQAEFALSDLFYLVTGYDYHYESVDSFSTFSITPPGPNTITGNGADLGFTQQTNALYALLSTYLTENLTLNTGIRWNHIVSDGDRSYLKTAYNLISYDNNNFNKQTNVQTVGSIGLVYDTLNDFIFRLNYSQGFRTANIQELYLTTMTGEMQIGNSNLKPETSDNYEFGIRYTGDIFNLDTTFFYTHTKDYIETREINSSVHMMKTFMFDNINEANAFGVEVDTKLKLGNFEPYTIFSFMRREYIVGSTSTYNTGTPKLKGKVGLKYNDNYKNIRYYIDLYSRFASESINDGLAGTSYFDNQKLPGYMTGNIEVGCSFGSNHEYKLFAGVENLFDKEYKTSELIDEPGRFFIVGVTASL